ncbi:MAG: hypothetical protein M1820_009950 [Bogoriella megaspora]|nr:MAG: hypothetical protein M1820_009950 [Bogoriella megaspora]
MLIKWKHSNESTATEDRGEEVRNLPSWNAIRLNATSPPRASPSSTFTDCRSVDSELGLGSPTSTQAAKPEPPYHILSKRQKWILVSLVSLAGMFSPLSSNIYFPAIDTISADLGVSISLVALTITVYMIVQGIAPSFFGPFSDTCGRRLVFTVVLVIYLAANLGLAFTTNFPMLLILRGIQAAGSSATISIGAGVIGDIATPSERGGFIGTNSGIRMIGQAIGPVFGGILNGEAGFRSIFWFLFAAAAVVLLGLLTFLPETHRTIAGNGSVPLSGFHKPWIYIVLPPREWAHAQDRPKAKTPPLSFRKILTPLAHVFEKDIVTLLLWGAIVYTVWSMVTSSTASVLQDQFPSLTNVELGLCFLPNGLGCFLGSVQTGKTMDWLFKRVEDRYRQENNIPDSVKIQNHPNFPYERARLAQMPYLSGTFIVVTALYGASYELNSSNRRANANLAAPLILQFFIAYTATAIFSINSSMMVDCFPAGPAGATAVNNLFRCSLGAAGVSIIEPLIKAVKIRNAFLTLAGIVLLCSPLVFIESHWGERWRIERYNRGEKSNLSDEIKGKQPG